MADGTRPSDPRRMAVKALMRVHRDGDIPILYGKAHWKPGASLRLTAPWPPASFWGVIERRLTLDYLIGCYSRTPVKKLQPAVREILRSGLYQLLYMDRIPVPAAVNESVNLTRSMGVGHASRFVNAVMRAAAREGLGRIEGLPEGEEKRSCCPPVPGS